MIGYKYTIFTNPIVGTAAVSTEFLIDFGGDLQPPPENWNDIQNIGQPLTQLIDSDGNLSNIFLTITVPFTAVDYSGGMPFEGVPSSVTVDCFNVRGYISANSVIEFSNLDSSKKYSVFIYSSQTGVAGMHTFFWINNELIDITSSENDSIAADYINITPDVSNKIILEVNTNTNYGYLNAIRFVEH
jgi:hypothetical protein